MNRLAAWFGCVLLVMGGAWLRPAVAQDSECWVTARGPRLPVYSAPIESSSHLLYVLEDVEGESYPALYQHALDARDIVADPYPFYYAQIDDEIEGWVSHFNVAVSDWATCTSLPEDETLLSAFPGICGSVIGRSATEVFWWCSHAMSCSSPADSFGLSDSCEGLEFRPTVAFIRTLLFSTPDINEARGALPLPQIAKVIVVNGPVRGPIDAAGTEGNWYQIYADGFFSRDWVWEGQLEMGQNEVRYEQYQYADYLDLTGEPFQIEVMVDTQLWTIPDGSTGRGMQWVQSGTILTALYGPVGGYGGNMYYVVSDSSNVRGWISSGVIIMLTRPGQE